MKEIKELIDISSEMKYSLRINEFSGISALVEKWQNLANRMEAGLDDKRDLKEMQEEWSKKRKELKELTNDIKLKKIELESIVGKSEDK